MPMTIAELAQLVGGRVVGDATITIQAAKPIEEAGPGDLTFIENPQRANRLAQCRASAALVPPSVAPNGMCLILVEDPLWAFVAALNHLVGATPRREIGIHPLAWISRSARIGQDANIHPFAAIDDDVVIGDRCEIHSGVHIGRGCTLGDDVVLYPNAVLYPASRLGHRVIIHAGAVIGADGFGYRTRDGRHEKVPQLGHVEIGNDTEIGACTTIDRGTFGATVIGEGTKIDNLVQVAHNCRIGKHNIMAGQVGLAGSCTTGDYVVMAGQVGIRDHVTIGAGTRIGAQAGVVGNAPEGAEIVGSPATPAWKQKRLVMALARLPELRRQVREMQKEIQELRCRLPLAQDRAAG